MAPWESSLQVCTEIGSSETFFFFFFFSSSFLPGQQRLADTDQVKGPKVKNEQYERILAGLERVFP